MAKERESQAGVTRREFVYMGAAGVAGLVVGGVIGNQLGGDGGGGDTSGSSSSGGGSAAAGDIVVGGAFPLTGVLAGDGQDMMKGLELAVQEINDSGGVLGRRLVVKTADIESDLAPDKVSNAVGRLVNEEGAAVVTMGYMEYTHAAFKAPSETGVPLLHTNAYSGDAQYVADNPDKYSMVFQTCATDVQYGQNFGRVLKDWVATGQFKPRKKTVAIISSTDPYSLSVADNFQNEVKNAGWQVPVYEKVNAPLSEWGPVLAKVRAVDPDVVMNTDYYVSDLASFTKQFVANPTNSLLYEQYGPAVPEYLDLVGDAGNGVVWQTNAGITPDQIGEPFVKAFEAKYGKPPGVGGPGLLYDQVYIWATAASLAADPTAYAEVAQHIKQTIYRGVLGAYNFTAADQTAFSYPVQTRDAGLGMPMFIYQIQNQKQVLIDPEPFVAGKLQMPPWM